MSGQTEVMQRFLDPAGVADLLDLPAALVLDAVECGWVPSFRMDGGWRIEVLDQAFLRWQLDRFVLTRTRRSGLSGAGGWSPSSG